MCVCARAYMCTHTQYTHIYTILKLHTYKDNKNCKYGLIIDLHIIQLYVLRDMSEDEIYQ